MDPLFYAALGLPIGFAIAYAVQPKSADRPASTGAPDPAFLELMGPGPEHQQIAKVAGTWNVDCTMWMKEGEDPIESTGLAIFTPMFDGRFVNCEYKGTFMGQPFHGRSTLGYDRAAKRYFTTWHDSMATGFTYLSGTSSDGGRTIVYTGESVCPQQGPINLRQVETHESDDRFTLTMYQTPQGGGKETKAMELVYVRK
jgi:hypothetical protein